MTTEVTVAELPNCDLCYALDGRQILASYDGKTVNGPWAYLCEMHFHSHGTGLGTGVGQRLKLREPR
ncbi:MAG: hypothetical protein EHM24_11200 [Acidobacteria bacterium]|nr:MAG: hypothetical protein EHM24_11200 [Acidobacteriota bacterium]